MSVLSEYDRFIAIQQAAIPRLMRKISRRKARGKPVDATVKALANVEEALGRTRDQRADVNELVVAGEAQQAALDQYLAALESETEVSPEAKRSLTALLTFANERLARALAIVGAPA